jgi:hypothetical protein
MALSDDSTTTISLDSNAFGHWLSTGIPLSMHPIPATAWGGITTSAVYRALCTHLVNQLDEKRLIEACDALRDILVWQQESKSIAHEVKDDWSFAPASHRKSVLNEPFRID